MPKSEKDNIVKNILETCTRGKKYCDLISKAASKAVKKNIVWEDKDQEKISEISALKVAFSITKYILKNKNENELLTLGGELLEIEGVIRSLYIRMKEALK